MSARFQACISPIFLVPHLQFKLVRPLSSVGSSACAERRCCFWDGSDGLRCRVAFCGWLEPRVLCLDIFLNIGLGRQPKAGIYGRKEFLRNLHGPVSLLSAFASHKSIRWLVGLGYDFRFGCERSRVQIPDDPTCSFETAILEDGHSSCLLWLNCTALLGTCCLSTSTSCPSTWSLTYGFRCVEQLAQSVRDWFHWGRNSSVGRALDWRSKGPWFNPGFRQRGVGSAFWTPHWCSRVSCFSQRLLLSLFYFANRRADTPSSAWFHGVTVSTLDSESSDPSSNLGGTC